jgi:hypothetical protein
MQKYDKSTHLLHSIHILSVKRIMFHMLIQPLHSVLQINLCPFLKRFRAEISFGLIIRIRATTRMKEKKRERMNKETRKSGGKNALLIWSERIIELSDA